MRELRDAGIVVIGGFHSPMERECLTILLRGSHPVILCAARRLEGLRLGPDGRRAVDDGRLLVVSTFGQKAKRTTAAQAIIRNEFVAAHAQALLIPHASPGGKTEMLARQIVERGQNLYTFDDENNTTLIRIGASPYSLDAVSINLAVLENPQS
jgi:hypothetical protein